MIFLYLKGYKWLLFQTQRVRNDFCGYRLYEALAKHIKQHQNCSQTSHYIDKTFFVISEPYNYAP